MLHSHCRSSGSVRYMRFPHLHPVSIQNRSFLSRVRYTLRPFAPSYGASVPSATSWLSCPIERATARSPPTATRSFRTAATTMIAEATCSSLGSSIHAAALTRPSWMRLRRASRSRLFMALCFSSRSKIGHQMLFRELLEKRRSPKPLFNFYRVLTFL